MSIGSVSRWPWWRRWFGDRSERAAIRFLKKLGYRILKRNYECPRGEIDLIALDRDTIVFVEVRSTAGDDFEKLAASIDERKQSRICRAATHFLYRHRLEKRSCRFDVVLMGWAGESKYPKIVHYPAAFNSSEP